MREDELSKIFLRASELFKIGDYQNASVELKRAYELQPNSISILINLSSVLIKTGNQQEALFLINKGFNLEPQNYDLLLNYATILMLNNKIIESINILEKISIANSKRNEAFINLGRCYSLNLLRKNHHEKVISSSLFNCSDFAKDFKNKIYEICKTKIPNLVS